MKDFIAQKAIERAIEICKYEPEFHYNPDNHMITIWDYSADQAQAFYREDYCHVGQINLDDLIQMIYLHDFSYDTTLLDAFNYIPQGTICYVNGTDYEISEQLIYNYLEPYHWSNEDKQAITKEICFRMSGLDIDTTAIQPYNFIEDAYTDAACNYIALHNNSIQALLDEVDDCKIFDCMGMDIRNIEEEYDEI